MKPDFMNIIYKDRGYVSHLAPESLLEELKQQGQYALAMGISDESGENVIIGLACFYVDPMPLKEHFLAVRWFYILPEYREKGYGRMLYNRLCDIAVENRISRIDISFPDIDETKKLQYIFYEMEFEYPEGDLVEIYTNLEQVATQPTIAGKLNPNNEAVKLNEVSELAFKRYIHSLSDKRVHLAEYLLPDDPNLYEKEISHVILNNSGKIEAALLIRNINGALEPVVFVANGKNAEAMFKLLSKGIDESLKKYGKAMTVRFRSTEATKWALYDQLFPDLDYRPVIHGSMEIDYE